MELSRFMARRHTAAVTTVAARHVAISQTALMPKNHTAHAEAGMSAMITSRMIACTLVFECACGEELKM